jgi:septal ring factor EnvC (AmiA/AmiB activator)
MILRQFIHRLIVIAILLCSVTSAFAQKKTDLQQQRDEINEKIALTKKLIRESESQQKNTSSQLAVLNEQIAYRESLIKSISKEITVIHSEIQSKEQRNVQLEQQIKDLKEEYGRMVYLAYRNRSAYDRLMYIFAAEDFNQAFKRFKITQHYADARKKQVDAIKEMQAEIAENISGLSQNKKEKESLAGDREKEKAEIDEAKKSKQQKLNSLQQEEKKLRDQQKKQEADRKSLTKKIEEIIQAELAAERKKAEEERKKAEAQKAATADKSGTTTAAPKSTTSSSSTTSASSSTSTKSAASTLAPEVKLLNADFEKNKGALPWPVSSGIISTHFGRHAHPSISGIEVNNNGVDFITEGNGYAQVIFTGTVSSVFNIPGAGMNVIVTHGTYKSVYSGLKDVSVKVGDKVTAKQRIGAVLSDGDESILHFEIWKVNAESGAAQNPELWIKKR